MNTFILTHKEREVSPIALLVSYMGRRYRLPIGETVKVSLWNSKTKRIKVRGGDEHLAVINDRLDAWQKAADKAIVRFKDREIVPERDELFTKIRELRFGRDIREETILSRYFDTFIERYSGIRSRNRLKQYKLIKGVLLRYERDTGQVLRFDDIDMGFHHSFSKWFGAKGYSPNYLGDCIKVIRTVMRDAEEIDKLHTNRTPYSKLFTVPSARVDNIYLTEAELVAMYKLDIDERLVSEYRPDLPWHKARSMATALRSARDMFIIGAFTGLRFSDLSRLGEGNIKDGFFELYNHKTDYKTVIPIHWVIREMLDNGYDFSTRMYEQKLNKHIKIVARLAGITEDVTLTRFSGKERIQTTKPKCDWITSHTARRSFATNAYLAGIPTISIMKITGHKRESTFLDYIKVSEMENAERLRKMAFFTGENGQNVGVPFGVPNGVPDGETE